MQVEDIVEHWLAQARQQLQQLPYALSLCPSTEYVDTTRPAGSWLGGRLNDLLKSSWLVIWPLALLLFLLYWRSENDQPIRYRVPSPRTPEKEELLSNPSTKVCARLRT